MFFFHLLFHSVHRSGTEEQYDEIKMLLEDILTFNPGYARIEAAGKRGETDASREE
jgi:hypothetical protein